MTDKQNDDSDSEEEASTKLELKLDLQSYIQHFQGEVLASVEKAKQLFAALAITVQLRTRDFKSQNLANTAWA